MWENPVQTVSFFFFAEVSQWFKEYPPGGEHPVVNTQDAKRGSRPIDASFIARIANKNDNQLLHKKPVALCVRGASAQLSSQTQFLRKSTEIDASAHADAAVAPENLVVLG